VEPRPPQRTPVSQSRGCAPFLILVVSLRHHHHDVVVAAADRMECSIPQPKYYLRPNAPKRPREPVLSISSPSEPPSQRTIDCSCSSKPRPPLMPCKGACRIPPPKYPPPPFPLSGTRGDGGGYHGLSPHPARFIEREQAIVTPPSAIAVRAMWQITQRKIVPTIRTDPSLNRARTITHNPPTTQPPSPTNQGIKPKPNQTPTQPKRNHTKPIPASVQVDKASRNRRIDLAEAGRVVGVLVARPGAVEERAEPCELGLRRVSKGRCLFFGAESTVKVDRQTARKKNGRLTLVARKSEGRQKKRKKG